MLQITAPEAEPCYLLVRSGSTLPEMQLDSFSIRVKNDRSIMSGRSLILLLGINTFRVDDTFEA